MNITPNELLLLGIVITLVGTLVLLMSRTTWGLILGIVIAMVGGALAVTAATQYQLHQIEEHQDLWWRS